MSALPLAIWIVVAAYVFAKVEVQIEGPNGWAGALPTWRVEQHALLDLFWGGRPMTGYHAWMFLFMGLLFHFPLVLTPMFSVVVEARILGSLSLFWILEDFLWFALNPAYGIRRFRRGTIDWHRHWVGPVPSDYITLGGAGLLLVLWSFHASA